MKTLIILLTIFTIIFIKLRANNRSGKNIVLTKKPSVLNDAYCLMNETNIKTSIPVPLHGRVDQVFKLKDGRLLLVDSKDRERVLTYPSDIVQLSTYAIILKYKGYNVCPTAFIRIPIDNNRAIFIPVKLYSEEIIISLYNRYKAIERGKITPRCTCNKHFS